MLRAVRRAARRQGHVDAVRGRRLRRQHQAVAISVPHPEDAADTAREGHHRGVHQERGVQVRAGSGRVLHAADRVVGGLLQVPGTAVGRQPQVAPAEPRRPVRVGLHGRVHRLAVAGRARVRRHTAARAEPARAGGEQRAGAQGVHTGGGHRGRRGVVRRGGTGHREEARGEGAARPGRRQTFAGQGKTQRQRARQEKQGPGP